MLYAHRNPKKRVYLALNAVEMLAEISCLSNGAGQTTGAV